MLERFFSKPETVDRIRGCWLGSSIEDYVGWLVEEKYASRNVFRRVPLLTAFAAFSEARGIRDLSLLPTVIDDFVAERVRRSKPRNKRRRHELQKEIRSPIRHYLRHLDTRGLISLPQPPGPEIPFRKEAPEFFEFLKTVRGLKESSCYLHRHHLLFFERYLSRIRLRSLAALTPAHISAFIVSEGRRRCKQVMCLLCTALRTFLRYAYMKAVVPEDLSSSVPRPKTYRKSSLPRSITWDEVKAMLAVVDRRTPVGLRDHAMLLLIVTYGLRAREVASLQLGDIDWKRDRLHIRERKAKHATTYPLSETVGQAVLAYLQHARPETDQRRLFLCCLPPVRPVTHATVSMRVTKYLRKAGARVPRPGSHTLRHTCVTRLVDAGFSLKEIGDYVAHRSPVSTAVYAKVSMRNLREVALSDGEDML